MLVLLGSWFLACSGGGADSGQNDSAGPGDTRAIDTSASFCDGVPALAYTNFGEGFLRENCQGCHASGVPNRFGAPKAVVFDSVEDAWARAERILARSAGDAPTMPPQGGVSPDDRTRLGWWLVCGTPGT